MRNNGLIFLGFLIVCLVNLSGARNHHSSVSVPQVEAVKKADPAELKMATELPPGKVLEPNRK